MTIYSVFGASLAATAFAGSLMFPATQPESPRAPTPVVAKAVLDDSATIVFDRDGHRIGRSTLVVPAENGGLVAVMSDSDKSKSVTMMRGPDGLLRLVAD